MILTKSDLIQALQKNFKKKNALLYLYFQELFDSSQSSSFVIMKIHDELGIQLSKSHVDTIRYRMDKTTARKLKSEMTIQKRVALQNSVINENKPTFTDPFAIKSKTESIIQPIL